MLSEDDAPQAFIAPECAVADVQQTVGQFEGFDVQRAVERMRAISRTPSSKERLAMFIRENA